jgi:anti-sigma factor RsiW
LVRPLTLHVVAGALTVQVAPPGLAVTVYELMAAPPLLDGAVQETEAEPFDGVAATEVGAPGTVTGVTELEAEDGLESPAVLWAVTVKV